MGANGNRNTGGAFPSLPRRDSFGDLKIWDRYRRRGRGRGRETRAVGWEKNVQIKLGPRVADLAPMIVSGSSLPFPHNPVPPKTKTGRTAWQTKS